MPTLELPHNEVEPNEQQPRIEAEPVRHAELRGPSHLAQFGDRLLQLVDRVAVFNLMPADASGYPSDHRPVRQEPHVISENWYRG